MRQKCIIVLFILSTNAFCYSFGVVGETFPVIEKSFLVLISERLTKLTQSGEIEAFNRRWIKRIASQANRPNPLGLPRTSKTTHHYYSPEITLSQSILDAAGQVIIAQGTHVNALKALPSYHPCWLFFNADDLAQLRWAQKQMQGCDKPKLILTGGAIKATENFLKAVIYFDQAGFLSTKLNITSVPARVTRRGNRLYIEESAIKENGDVI